MIIYMATNRINGKQYVGQTVSSLKRRRQKHITAVLCNLDNYYFHKAIRKYGKEEFRWTILHDNVTTIEFLNRLEVFYIGYYDTFDNGYNLTLGGGGMVGWCPSEETRMKTSKTLKGRYVGKDNPNYGKKLSEEQKKKLYVANKGKKHSDETKQKQSKARKGVLVGEKNGMYGKTHSIETKQQMRMSHKNRKPISDETRRRMCRSQSGENHPNYGKKGKDSARTREVVINKRLFYTLKEASEFLGLTPSAVRHRILHKNKWLEYKYVV